MTPVRDHYHVLGVPRFAKEAEIRAAFVRLAKLHHPDLSQPGRRLPDRLRHVHEAYHCLIDPSRRAQHDRDLHAHDRAHHRHMRRLRRRLRRLDGRHIRTDVPPPRPAHPTRWRPTLALALGGASMVFLMLLLCR